jgi:hypothetical protein
MFFLEEKLVQKILGGMAGYRFYERKKKEESWDALNSKIESLNNNISTFEWPSGLETYRLSNFNMSA